MYKYSLILLLLLTSGSVFGQADSNSWLPAPPPHYSFIKYDENVIGKRYKLDSFYFKLAAIRHTHKGRVNIIHIGDSHLQADGITSVLRYGFQDYFGDAGRGLVFPYQLAATNAPHDIQSSSNTTWKSNRLTSPDKPVKTGIAGYGLQCGTRNSVVRMHLKETDGRQDRFNHMLFFLGGDSTGYRVTDSAIPYPVMAYWSRNASFGMADVRTDSLLTGFELSRVGEAESDFSFYGVSLDRKEASGVLYHTIGVNGARYDQFLQQPLLWQQLQALHGDLFIVSLGTNEAQNQFVNEQTLIGYCDSFVKCIHKIAPHAEVIITTPCGSYFKQKKPNKSISKVTDAYKRYCEEKEISCWDAFNICGGLEGIPAWKKYNLISHDLIHYNNEGYHLQGLLLLNALAKGYTNYEKVHPWKPAKIAVAAVKPAPPVTKPKTIVTEVVKAGIGQVPKTTTAETPKEKKPAVPVVPAATDQPTHKSNIEVRYEN